MRRWTKKLTFSGLAVAFVLAASLLAVPKAHADANDFIVKTYDADYSLTNKDPQGELHIVERISVHFNDNNHGILRAVPDYYKRHRLEMKINSIKSNSGAPAQYTTYTENGNTVIKIGDPNRTVTGDQEYTLDFTLRNVVTFYKGYDELYWDINGDQWHQEIDNINLTLHLPQGLKATTTQPVCDTGKYGSTSRNCTVSYDQGAKQVVAATTAPLMPGETLTVVTTFQKGYFHPAKWYETAGEYRAQILGFIVPLLLFAVPAFIYWFRRGRDPRGRRVIVPEYEAPDKLKPIEVGTITDFATDNKDITATIIDLAIRGYIRIIEQQKDKMIGKRTTYTLKLLKSGRQGLNDYETDLLDGVFGSGKAGAEVDLAALKYKLSTVATGLRKQVKDSLLERGYFQRHPITKGVVMASLAVLALWGATLVMALVSPEWLSWLAVIIGTMAGVGLAALFLVFSRSRTLKGVETREHIMGLRLYLKTAEADRIKMLQSPKARYAQHSKGPAMTVDLFEKLLPYAMVLGVEEEWAKQFKDIYKTPPDWYSGHWTTFSVIYLTSSISSGVSSAVNVSFSSPSNASGSGAGGGFAGGGGGGGGGGGW